MLAKICHKPEDIQNQIVFKTYSNCTLYIVQRDLGRQWLPSKHISNSALDILDLGVVVSMDMERPRIMSMNSWQLRCHGFL